MSAGSYGVPGLEEWMEVGRIKVTGQHQHAFGAGFIGFFKVMIISIASITILSPGLLNRITNSLNS